MGSCSTSDVRDVVQSEYVSDIKEVLFTSSQIQAKCKELARQISADYRGKDLVCVALLRGGYKFHADLCSYISIPHQVDFMAVSSYNGTQSTGKVDIQCDMRIEPKGKHILFVEDLIETGQTLYQLQQHFKDAECASTAICCLLRKQCERVRDVKLDYFGFDVRDEFVVGYGMDYKNHYRSLPFVGVLNENVYTQQQSEVQGGDDDETAGINA